jgi:AcrR family transcriptional regulator
MRRERVLDAAIAVLGADGPRGLTHRAVDAEAGLPTGSTSNYFRSRAALVEALVGYVRYAVGPARVRTTARYALFLEAASARPELRAALARSRAAVVGWGTRWIAALGSPDPAAHCRLVLDYLDGLILHEMAFPDPGFDPAPGLRALLSAFAPD